LGNVRGEPNNTGNRGGKRREEKRREAHKLFDLVNVEKVT